jgi:hypothetical protein
MLPATVFSMGKKARSTAADAKESITCLRVGKPTKRPVNP